MSLRPSLAIACIALVAIASFLATRNPKPDPSGEETKHPSKSLPLLRISISPESRVKVDAGGATLKLTQNKWNEFPIIIENGARISSPLVIESAQELIIEGDTSRDRWLKLELEPSGKLSGRAQEVRTLRVWSRDAGKRSAVLNANAGQGTQDLGFRSDVLLTFDVLPEK